ncbi:helix-turn-helix domain-containing protein [Modestobacter sp. L9-4]|uniref:helix-turn-helix domain-containing protein n=1 Tax=Modestobacter sp. L9-4 TaxID=2851567 RepID=UPI001C775CF4|nr:helix-turn-helix domain-containing protein [Modestobacter sp. L9-4]QXG75937.1 helix-turn-helix domain-containing protein [Modestobacter sp. L9-4]
MVTLVDTDLLAPSERRPSTIGALLEEAIGSRVRFPGRRPPSRSHVEAWDLGGLTVTRAEHTGGLELTRSARQAREDTEPLLSFAVHEVGRVLQDHLEGRRVVPVGGLTLTDVSSPWTYRWADHGVCRSLQVPVARLGLSVDVVRQALPQVRRSPLYGLVSAHLEQVTRDAERLATEPMVHSLASATVDLTRALLASAVGAGPTTADANAETVLSQVRSYVRQHLTEPDLDAEGVAAALAVSVRQLYRLCATAGFSLEQWVIDQRLEGARAELADPGSRGRSIAAVARRWGFTDASYFSRRFRQAYGTTPREWRLSGPVALPVPRPGS